MQPIKAGNDQPCERCRKENHLKTVCRSAERQIRPSQNAGSIVIFEVEQDTEDDKCADIVTIKYIFRFIRIRSVIVSELNSSSSQNKCKIAVK